MRGEKEPTALVLVCEDGVECDVECIGGSCVCLKQRLGVKEGAWKFVGYDVGLKVDPRLEEGEKSASVIKGGCFVGKWFRNLLLWAVVSMVWGCTANEGSLYRVSQALYMDLPFKEAEGSF